MSEIPKDVMAAAMRALMVPEHEMVESVSRALMAERERCAKIAENAPIEAWATHVDMARREAYKVGVAAAIRNAQP